MSGSSEAPPPIPPSPALSPAPFFSAALNPPLFQKRPGVLQSSGAPLPHCLGKLVPRVSPPLSHGPSPRPAARPPSAHLPSFLSVLISEPFLLHVWHVPCVCSLSCSLPAPFQDMTKERKGWPWLHSLLLLMNAGAKTAGPANISAELACCRRRRNPSVVVLEGPFGAN